MPAKLRIILSIVILCFWQVILSGNLRAQTGTIPSSAYPARFSDNDAEFLTQLSAFMNRTQLNNVAVSVNEFSNLWNSSMDAEQKKACMQLFNVLVKKKLKPSPHFERMMDLIILADKRQLEPAVRLKLIQTSYKIVANMTAAQAFESIANIFLYLKYNLLYNNGFYKLKVSKPGKLSFDWIGPDASVIHSPLVEKALVKLQREETLNPP